MAGKFRSRLIAALAPTFIVSAAFAADLPSGKAAPVLMPPPPLWTGFYAGLNAGYSWGATSNAANGAFPLVDNIAADPFWGTPFGFATLANSGLVGASQSGFVGGGQVGYNYQWSPAIVVGLEADVQGAVIRGGGSRVGAAQFGPDLSGAIDTAVGASAINAGVDWIGTLRGWLGYLVMPTLLAFGTGGLAYGGVHASAAHALSFSDDLPSDYPTFGGVGRYADTRVGWTAGGGFEWMFAPGWSVKAEALYYDLGAATFVGGPVGAIDPDGSNLIIGVPGAFLFANSVTTRVKYDGVLARAGVNYHFDWGVAPVVAKF